MKFHKSFLWLLLSLLASLYAALPSLASERSYETEVINNIAIGDISIGLCEYDLNDEGKEMPCEQGICVLPGQELKRIIRVTNLAGSAWVRVKVEYLQADILYPFPESMIILSDDRWIFRGGYFYRTLPLYPGEGTDLSRGIIIPPYWGEKEAGEDLTFIVTAEAVQEANFTPDFSLEDPWFGTLIETCVHTGHKPMMVRYENFSVLFEGGAEGLIRIGDDFFTNFGRLMPGDSATDTVVIRNDYARPITLYFRTEGIADDDLADRVWLTIQGNEGIIFDGKISESRDEIEVASLEKGEEETFSYTLFIPPEFGNSYALTETADKWIFRASLNVAEDTGSPPSSGRHRVGGAGGSKESVNAEDPLPAAELVPYAGELSKTGEGRALVMAGAFLASSGLLLLIILIMSLYSRAASPPGRKKKRGEDK